MKTYLCPIDEVVFETENDHRPPHHANGHSECPGPNCRKKFEVDVTPVQRAELARKAAATKKADAHRVIMEAERAERAYQDALKAAQLPEVAGSGSEKYGPSRPDVSEDLGVAGEEPIAAQ